MKGEPTKRTTARPLRRVGWAACAASALFGCSVGPNYVRPTAESPSAYKEAIPWKPAEPRDQEPRGNWWDVFKDPKLDALVAPVEVSNQTIKAADARVREARALTQAARAALFPMVSASASATRSGSGSGTARSNSDGLNTFRSNPFSDAGEYGPASTDIRNRFTFGGTINTRWNVRAVHG